ncbi:MAG: L,D-transpeptidase family protein [Methyloligellaceae bacterium]
MAVMIVRKSSRSATQGVLQCGEFAFPCALGRGGIVSFKFEGDGGTPVGKWYFRKVFYRSDRVKRFPTGLPMAEIRDSDGWCDAPWDANYNRFVKLPYRGRSENLMRDDELYNIIAVLSHNDSPRIHGGGSAIFVHVAKSHYQATEGCIALKEEHLKFLLRSVNRSSYVRVVR